MEQLVMNSTAKDIRKNRLLSKEEVRAWILEAQALLAHLEQEFEALRQIEAGLQVAGTP